MVDDALTALADGTRRAVFDRLVADGPLAVGEIARDLPVSRPAVSQHLKVLVAAGLVRVTAQGTRRIYRVDADGLAVLRSWIDDHWGSVLDSFEHAARTEAAMRRQPTIAPVVKIRTVPLDVRAAFTLFTARIGEWWPTTTHAITADDAAASPIAEIRFDERVGGQVTEVLADGTEHSWADVLAWDPPHRFVLSWHPNPTPTAASRLEVTFAEVDGGTRVVVEHGGWDEFGDRGADLRAGYDTGWEPVLAQFTDAAERALTA